MYLPWQCDMQSVQMRLQTPWAAFLHLGGQAGPEPRLPYSSLPICGLQSCPLVQGLGLGGRGWAVPSASPPTWSRDALCCPLASVTSMQRTGLMGIPNGIKAQCFVFL